MNNDDQPDLDEADFRAKADAAWDEVRAYWDRPADHADDPDPGPRLAGEFFDMYLARRPGDIATQQALQQAFALWANLHGGSRLIEEALTRVGDDWAALSAALGQVWYAFRLDGRMEEGDALLASLLDRIPAGAERADALLDLVQSWMWSGESTRARAACEHIIAWNVSEQHVEQAKASLYELDNLNVGQMAPVFQTHDIDGNPVDLAALRGKTVLLNFWATWCGPCRAEFPQLHRVAERFAGANFVLLSISLDDDCQTARKMIAKERLIWMHVCDGGFDSALAKFYNVMGIPTKYLIDSEGRIAT